MDLLTLTFEEEQGTRGYASYTLALKHHISASTTLTSIAPITVASETWLAYLRPSSNTELCKTTVRATRVRYLFQNYLYPCGWTRLSPCIHSHGGPDDLARYVSHAPRKQPPLRSTNNGRVFLNHRIGYSLRG